MKEPQSPTTTVTHAMNAIRRFTRRLKTIRKTSNSIVQTITSERTGPSIRRWLKDSIIPTQTSATRRTACLCFRRVFMDVPPGDDARLPQHVSRGENHACTMADGGYLTPPYRGHHVRFEPKQAELVQSKASWSQQVVQEASCC